MANLKITVPDMGDFKDVEVIEVLVKDGQTINKNDSILIIDDLKARKIANTLSLRFTCSVGILITAKKLGFIYSVKYYLEKIQTTNFRISDALIFKALEIVNEK